MLKDDRKLEYMLEDVRMRRYGEKLHYMQNVRKDDGRLKYMLVWETMVECDKRLI